jgi:hypothetical protein
VSVDAECLMFGKRCRCRECYFAECVTRQSTEHLTKSQIPIVQVGEQKAPSSLYSYFPFLNTVFGMFHMRKKEKIYMSCLVLQLSTPMMTISHIEYTKHLI